MPGDRQVGRVTSSAMGHTVGRMLAMAYVDTAHSWPGNNLVVEIGGRPIPAKVAQTPFFDPENARVRAETPRGRAALRAGPRAGAADERQGAGEAVAQREHQAGERPVLRPLRRHRRRRGRDGQRHRLLPGPPGQAGARPGAVRDTRTRWAPRTATRASSGSPTTRTPPTCCSSGAPTSCGARSRARPARSSCTSPAPSTRARRTPGSSRARGSPASCTTSRTRF